MSSNLENLPNLALILSSILSIVIMPFTTNFLARHVIRIERIQLGYKYQLRNAFLSVSCAVILAGWFPYANIVLFVGWFTLHSKEQLSIRTHEAFGLAMAGLLLLIIMRSLCMYTLLQLL